MSQSRFRLLSMPGSLSARLAMFFLAIMLTGLVLLLLTVLDMVGLSPVDMRHTFSWVVLASCMVLLLLAGWLWLFLNRQVLHPLEQIQQEAWLASSATPALGQVAATMRELREAVSRTQAELDESTRNLRHVEKLAMVGQLAAGVAHSVRNPLTSVKLRLFSLERGLGADSRYQEDLAVIADAIRHVDGIVSNFLEFSRRPDLRPERISPSSVVDASLSLLESRLSVFPVSLTKKRKGPLPEVYADPEQLREALLNILLNACEAMDYSGNLTIEEGLVKRQGHLFAFIRIEDSGPGIAAEKQKDIFTPFFSTKEQGTGLGLPIAKSILEEHGGDIEVRSPTQVGRDGNKEVQGGTSFSLLLPLEPLAVQMGTEEEPRRVRSRHRPDIAAPE
ncbi:two-component sensor histidine kinase [Desulfovibrio sp. OttesenSCG-928-G15]|nr:two-component sensor histidine kinase [Desulfovibrio sp. OttesenSCG-928-G15]